jgi:translation initiation factor 3 subunit J
MSDLSDWDADDYEPPVVSTGDAAVPAQWDDDDDEAVAPEGSSAAVASAVQAPKAPAKYAEMTREQLLEVVAKLESRVPKQSQNKNKKLKKKLRAREEADVQEAEAAAAAAAEAELTPEEQVAARIAERRQIEEQDFEAAKGLFGEEEEQVVLIEAMHPKTLADFEAMQRAIAKKALKYDASPHYLKFVEALSRELCTPLDSEDIRGITKALNVISNEKAKQERSKKSKKKQNTKAQLSGGKGAAASMAGFLDDGHFDDDYGDDLDFM